MVYDFLYLDELVSNFVLLSFLGQVLAHSELNFEFIHVGNLEISQILLERGDVSIVIEAD